MSGNMRLVVRQGPYPGQAFELLQPILSIGRERGNDIRLNEPLVSRRHARLILESAGYVLHDLGSTNGTFVNNRRITTPTLVQPGDALRFGDNMVLEAQGSIQATPFAPPPRAAWPAAPPAPPSFAPHAQRQPPRPARTAPTCPRCRQSDTVQTATQANISAPLEPADSALKVITVIRWVFAIFFGFVATIVVGGLLLAVGTTLLGASVDYAGGTGGILTLFTGAMLLPMLCILPVVLIVFGGILVAVPWLIARYIKQNYRRQLSQWQRAMNKWEKLHYCFQCAGVFLEGQNRLVPLEQMHAFLYEIGPSPLVYGAY